MRNTHCFVFVRKQHIHLISVANWDGFHDDETGIFGYTWAVGTEVCMEDIHPHTDPHANLFDETEWTHTGLVHSLSLDGK